MEELHPLALRRTSKALRARGVRTTRSWYGTELTLERKVGVWNVEIPVRIGANGGSMIGVARDQIVIQCLVRPNMQGYEVLGVRDDGRLLVSDGTLRGWAVPYTEGEPS
jgi:hypothetical protein